MKTERLLELIEIFKSGDFYSASNGFAELLKGERVDNFYSSLNLFTEKIFLNAKEFIKILNANQINCYLVSLTSDFIAEKVANKLGFKSWMAMKYGIYAKNNVDFFDGSIYPKVKDPAVFKASCFERFKLRGIFQNSIAVGDSKDDLLLFENCKYRILVGNKLGIAKKFDNIFILNKDWSNLAQLKFV